MGLERMACLIQGVDSIFDIDTIRYILDGVAEASGIKYNDGNQKADISMRIIRKLNPSEELRRVWEEPSEIRFQVEPMYIKL